MNKLLTLLAVCICCISILGLKVRLDIYVHDKNEVITTMANKSNDTEVSLFGDVIGGPVGFWDYMLLEKPELRKKKQELKAERAKQQAQQDPNKFYTNKKDILNAINEQIRANKNIRFRNNSHNLSLFRLAQLQNEMLYGGNPRQKIIHDLELAIPQSADMSYTDMLKYYLNSDGINPDNVQDIISNILHYTHPFLKKYKGILDPKNFSEDITKRLQNFYRKVWQIHQLAPGEDKINQLKELVNTPDFDDFYGFAANLSRGALYDLTHKDFANDNNESLDNDYYQQYLKELENNDAMPIAPPTEDTFNSEQLPSLNDILGNVNQDQENQENQENQEDVVEAPEDGETVIIGTDSYEPGTMLNNILSNAGPAYALEAIPHLSKEDVADLSRVFREYALKNGILTDKPKDPESFKPYVPKFYM